jgi:hypothetical protein
LVFAGAHMKSLKADETTEQLQKRIKQYEEALKLLPKGRVKEKLHEAAARLRSSLDMKQLRPVPGNE